MASHVLKYAKHGTYHSSLVKAVYENYIRRMKIPKTEPFSALDVGCGDGRILLQVLHPMLPNNCEELIAADIDESMIEYCKGINTKRNTSFIQMNIASEEIPGNLEERFSAIFSSYCFMYVRNLRQALSNCKKMLKNNGDILLVFISKKNPLYSTYAELSKIDVWKPYTNGFEGFVPHFSSDDPDSELDSLAKQVDLKVVGREFLHNYEFESDKRNFLEVYKSMDTVYRTIPAEKRERYVRDFEEIFSDLSGVDLKDQNALDEPAKMNIPTAVIHVRKY